MRVYMNVIDSLVICILCQLDSKSTADDKDLASGDSKERKLKKKVQKLRKQTLSVQTESYDAMAEHFNEVTSSHFTTHYIILYYYTMLYYKYIKIDRIQLSIC